MEEFHVKIEDVVNRLRAFNKARLEPAFSRVVVDWSSKSLPPLAGVFETVLPDGLPEDIVPRFFKKIIEQFPGKKHEFVRGVYKPFSTENYYKFPMGDIDSVSIIYPDEFYEEKVAWIASRLIPQLENDLSTIAPGAGNLSFIALRSSGTFGDGINHPYYFTFNIGELVRFQKPESMAIVKKLLSALGFLSKSDTGDLYFSIIKSRCVLDHVRDYACEMRACTQLTELNDVFYKWNDRLSLIEIPVMAERYLQQLYEGRRIDLASKAMT